MTWVFRKKLFPDASAEHVMCTVGEEGCFHLFFECQLALVIWAMQKIPWVDTSSEEAFWVLFRAEHQGERQKAEGFLWSYRQYGCIRMRSASRGRWPRQMG